MKLRLGRIAYINTRPVYYELDRARIPDRLDCVSATPSELNRMLAEGDIDVSPVSSVAYAKNYPEWLILPDLSISSIGEVLSVRLFTRTPLHQITGKTILLSAASETSVELLKLIMAEERVSPVYETKRIREKNGLLKEAVGALVIGDVALHWSRNHNGLHSVDLGQYWNQWTNKPFVFGLWAVRRSFARENPEAVQEVLNILHRSLEHGRDNISTIAAETASELNMDPQYMKRYYECLRYDLGRPEKAGLNLFFELLHKSGMLSEKVSLEFF